MTRQARWLVAAGMALALGVGGLAVAVGPFKAPPSTTVVAVVDLESVIQKLKEREDKEKALDTEQKKLQERLDSLTAEIKAEKTKIENEPAGPNQIAMAKAYREKIYRAEFEADYSKKLLAEMKGEMLGELFRRIEEATKTLAKQSGYQLVMTTDERASVKQGDPESVLRAIALKRILYSDPAQDITEEVVTYLNNQYAAGAKATTPGASATPRKP